MNLSEKNCTGCFKHFKSAKELTFLVDPKKETMDRYCDICLEKYKEQTKDEKVAVEIVGDKTFLYCYRCELRTTDRNLFMQHDCIKMNSNNKFVESLFEDKEK